MVPHEVHTAPQPGSRAAHWDRVHQQPATRTSWYEPLPDAALAVLDELGTDIDAPVLDVGAGATGIAAALLERGHRDLTALDVSATALATARHRLGVDAERVHWVVADLLDWTPPRRYRVWHDRAVFHFLVDEPDRRRYRDLLARALAPGAAVVVATFAPDGPPQCSGLPVQRYDADTLAAALGPGLHLRAARRVEHRTPTGAVQPFVVVGMCRA